MDRLKIPQKLLDWLGKYKFVLLIFTLGLLLMLLPEGEEQTEDPQETASGVTAEATLEEKLSQILSRVKGAGQVQVLLTYSSGEETVYQTDLDSSQKEGSVSQKSDTVTVTDAQRNQNGLIQRVDPPVYQGALIVCQGGDDPTVKLAIVEAVTKLTGLGADKICVLKMK